MDAWATALTAPYTVIVVGNDDGVGSAYEAYLQFSTTTNNGYIVANNGAQYDWYAGTADEAVGAVSNAPRVLGVIVNGASSIGYNSGSTPIWSGANIGTTTLTGLIVGGLVTGAFDNLNGKIAEVIVFSGALTATQINQVNCYLSNRYAIPLAQSAWADAVGVDSTHNLAQATYSAQPTLNMVDSAYNGQPTVSFSRASLQQFKSQSWTSQLPQPFTMFLVGQDDNFTTNNYQIYTDDLTTTESGSFYAAGGEWYVYGGTPLAIGDSIHWHLTLLELSSMVPAHPPFSTLTRLFTLGMLGLIQSLV